MNDRSLRGKKSCCWTGKHATNDFVGGVGFFSCSATTFFTLQWTVVHEHVFFGPPWTKSFAKSLFLLVHEQLYGIVRQHAFIPRWWTPPNSLADYLFVRWTVGWSPSSVENARARNEKHSRKRVALFFLLLVFSLTPPYCFGYAAAQMLRRFCITTVYDLWLVRRICAKYLFASPILLLVLDFFRCLVDVISHRGYSSPLILWQFLWCFFSVFQLSELPKYKGRRTNQVNKKTSSMRKNSCCSKDAI